MHYNFLHLDFYGFLIVNCVCKLVLSAGGLVRVVCLMEARKLQVVNHLEMRMDGDGDVIVSASCIMCADDAG